MENTLHWLYMQYITKYGYAVEGKSDVLKKSFCKLAIFSPKILSDTLSFNGLVYICAWQKICNKNFILQQVEFILHSGFA